MRRPSFTDFVTALAIVHGWTEQQAVASTKRPLAESALAAGWTGFGDFEVHSDDASKAAAVGARIVLNHAAIDGNKRVAVLIMSAMLSTAGLRITISDDELASLVERVAGREPVLTEVQFIKAIRAGTGSIRR